MTQIGPEQMVASGAPVEHLRQFFPTSKDAVEYYARYQAYLHGPQSLRPECCFCGRRVGRIAVEYQWEAKCRRFRFSLLHLALLGSGHLGSLAGFVHSDEMDFQSFHAACPSCWRAQRRRKAAAAFLATFALAGLICGLVGVPICLLLMILPDLTPHTRKLLLWLALVGFLLVVSYPLSRRLVFRWRVPQSLRHLARPPFYYYSCVLASKPVDVDGPIFTGSNREPLPIVVPSDFGKQQTLSWQHATMWLVFFSMFLWGWLAGDEGRSNASHIVGFVGLAVSFPAIWALQVWYWVSRARKRARELAASVE